MTMKNFALKYRSIIIFACSLVLIINIPFLFLASYKSYVYSSKIPQEASIIDVVARQGSNGSKLVRYKAEFSFDSRVITAQSAMSEWPPRHSVGSVVSVLYDEANPDVFYFDDFSNLWLLPSGLLFLCASFGAILLYVLLVAGAKGARPL